jgi:hypothetical protein
MASEEAKEDITPHFLNKQHTSATQDIHLAIKYRAMTGTMSWAMAISRPHKNKKPITIHTARIAGYSFTLNDRSVTDGELDIDTVQRCSTGIDADKRGDTSVLCLSFLS